MGIKEELLYDFSVNLPRLLIGGRTGIVDNVKKIVLISDSGIIVDCGAMYTAINGEGLTVNWLEDERMSVSGLLRSIEFYPSGGKE